MSPWRQIGPEGKLSDLLRECRKEGSNPANLLAGELLKIVVQKNNGSIDQVRRALTVVDFTVDVIVEGVQAGVSPIAVKAELALFVDRLRAKGIL